MSITRLLAKSTPQVFNLLRIAFNNSETYADKTTLPIPPEVYAKLLVYYPKLARETGEYNNAMVTQTGVTAAKRAAHDRLAMFCSHYHQVFNLGILRGFFAANDRMFYGIDVNSSKIPPTEKEIEVINCATNIKNGEAARVAAGGKPMNCPTAAEVEAEYQAFFLLSQEQTVLKRASNKEQEDISDILAEGIRLAADICDELEHKWRHDTDSSKRAKCREWGVVYKVVATNAGGEPIVPLTGEVKPQQKFIIMQGGFDANTSLMITNNGLVTIWIYTTARAEDNVPDTYLELAAGMQKEVFASELGAEGNTFLMVYNPSETATGLWEVVEVE
jgi:hypothetical protein